MSVIPYLRFIPPKVNLWFQQTCSLRNSLKIGKDNFELAIDVNHFCKDELRVKATQGRILIEGKHERKLDKGVIIREFSRKYKLPSGIDPKRIESVLTNEGILTIKAPRDTNYVAKDIQCENEIPIMIKCKTDAEAKGKEPNDDTKCLDPPNVKV